jgi:hypothetical protein
MVNSEELIGTTECLTLYTRCCINRCCYNRVQLYVCARANINTYVYNKGVILPELSKCVVFGYVS